MVDYAQKDRQELIAGSPAFERAMKVVRAKKVLGERWVLHPTNRVQRKPQEQRRA